MGIRVICFDEKHCGIYKTKFISFWCKFLTHSLNWHSCIFQSIFNFPFIVKRKWVLIFLISFNPCLWRKIFARRSSPVVRRAFTQSLSELITRKILLHFNRKTLININFNGRISSSKMLQPKNYSMWRAFFPNHLFNLPELAEMETAEASHRQLWPF